MQITCMQKRVCKHFEINDLGEHHDLYVQSDTLFLPDIFEIFDVSEIYELDPVKFISAPELSWQLYLKRLK